MSEPGFQLIWTAVRKSESKFPITRHKTEWCTVLLEVLDVAVRFWLGVGRLPSSQDFLLDGSGQLPSLVAEAPVNGKTFH